MLTNLFIVKRKENNLNNIWCICINILIDEQDYFQLEEHQRNEGKAEKMLWMDFIVFSSKVTNYLIRIPLFNLIKYSVMLC